VLRHREGKVVSAPAKRQPRDVLRGWITSVNDEGKKLTDWELHFMESITDHFDNGGNLSIKQEEILEKIYVDKV